MRQFFRATQRLVDVRARLFDFFQPSARESIDVLVLVTRDALEFDERGLLHQLVGDDHADFRAATLDRETNQFVIVLDVANQPRDAVRIARIANGRAADFGMAQQRAGIHVARDGFGGGANDFRVEVGEERREFFAVENFRQRGAAHAGVCIGAHEFREVVLEARGFLVGDRENCCASDLRIRIIEARTTFE